MQEEVMSFEALSAAGGSKDDLGGLLRACAVKGEILEIERDLVLGNYSAANLNHMQSYGYSPDYQHNEEAVFAMQETGNILRQIHFSGEKMTPEAFAVLDLGRMIADEMDVTGACHAFVERVSEYAAFDDMERQLASEVLNRGNHFSMLDRYVLAEGKDKKQAYKDMVEMVPKKRRAGYRQKQRTL